MILFYTLFTCIKSIETTKEETSDGLHNIKKLSNGEIESIIKEYKEYLEKNLGSQDKENISRYFIKDFNFTDLSNDQEKIILVWDLGGTYFKLSYVKIKIKEGKVEAKLLNIQQFIYPNEEEFKNVYWEDWATEIMVEFVLKNGKVPDASSLIVSYPLCYQEDDVYVEKFTKFFAFKRTQERRIKEAIRESIKKVLKVKKVEFEKFQMDDIEERLSVKTVVNDSVASYFSSKLYYYEFSIAIILGTGTNASFSVDFNNERYVYNSEWGAFKPTSVEFWDKEVNLWENMKKLYGTSNFLDVIAANGCKFDLINSLLDSRNEKITKENYKEVLKKPKDKRTKIYTVVMERSKQIIAALTLAAICYSNSKGNCLIVTNGSGFDNPKDTEVFKEIINSLVSNESGRSFKLDFMSREGLTLIGSALYTFNQIIN